MSTQMQILFSLILFEMLLFPLTATAFAMPGVTNPLTDLFPGSGTSPGAGTGQGLTSDTVSGTSDVIQSCVGGGLVGALTTGATFALVGAAFGGVGAIPAALFGGLVGGGLLGCGVSAAFFPQQGSKIFTDIVNSSGPLGDVVKTLAIALSYVGPLVTFLAHSVTFEVALLTNAPVIGVFLAPLQVITAIWLFIYIAGLVRGTGTSGI